MGGHIFTLSMSTKEAKPAGRYRKNKKTFNAQHSTPDETAPAILEYFPI
jgi:hypothetical protein